MDPIRDIARYNCACGKWIVLPKSFTKEKPFVCTGPCHSGPNVICGNRHLWDDGTVRILSKGQLDALVKESQ